MINTSTAWLHRALIAAMFLVAALVAFRPAASESQDAQDPVPTPVPAFSLTERSGRTVTNADFLGKVWIASFVFTRCTGPCPAVTATVSRLQAELADQPDLRFVTFTVDPYHDDQAELSRYADRFAADPERWLFLTGKEEDLYRLLRTGFLVHAQQNRGADRTPGSEVMHSTRLALVDKKGRLRAYASGLQNAELGEPIESFEDNLRRFRAKVAALLREAQ